MADESYGSVGTPRLFLDYVSYFRAIGYIDEFSSPDWVESKEGDDSEVWGLNPTNTKTFTLTEDGDGQRWIAFQAITKHREQRGTALQARNFMNTANYYMV